jgi:hypothetical protein
MRHSHAPPSACDGQKNVGQLAYEVSLQFRGQHQVTVTLSLGGERGEYSAAHAEVRRPHMRGLLSAFQPQSDAAKICCIHSRKYATRIENDLVGGAFLLDRADEFQNIVLADSRVRALGAKFRLLTATTPDCLYDSLEHSRLNRGIAVFLPFLKAEFEPAPCC